MPHDSSTFAAKAPCISIYIWNCYVRAYLPAAKPQWSVCDRKRKSKVLVKNIKDQTVPGPDGNKVPIRIYQPAGAVDRKKGLPILVFFHGGSFYMGDLDSHDDMCRNLGHLAAYIVVAVDYR